MIFDNRTVIVSGVGTGLGREVAQCALRDGANVVLAARTESVLEETAQALDPSGEHVAYQTTDITRAEDCESLVKFANARFGSIDAMIQVAAFEQSFGNLADTDFESWRKAFDTNVLGSMTLTRALAPAMKQAGGGSIVFIGSQSMYEAQLPQAGYAASKGALLTAMYYLSDELGPDGIRVNMVVPSWMWGPPVQGFVKSRAQREKVTEDEIVDGIRGNIPLRRIIPDEEVAEVCIFLASDRARGVSGQSIMVNGGELMR